MQALAENLRARHRKLAQRYKMVRKTVRTCHLAAETPAVPPSGDTATGSRGLGHDSSDGQPAPALLRDKASPGCVPRLPLSLSLASPRPLINLFYSKLHLASSSVSSQLTAAPRFTGCHPHSRQVSLRHQIRLDPFTRIFQGALLTPSTFGCAQAVLPGPGISAWP